MDKKQQVLDALQAGPIQRYQLLNGRKASFVLAYRQLIADGLIAENGTGGRGDPVYAGLEGVVFPVKRYMGVVRPADLKTLVRSGRTEEEARRELQAAIDSPGDNYAALLAVVTTAHERIIQAGGDPWADVPMPGEKRRPGRPRQWGIRRSEFV